MYYTVYKITNNINGKIYIGVHKTHDLNDDYMGSGKLIKDAIKKYGGENFIKEYLHIFDNQDDMFNMESVIVNEKFIKDSNTYNIKLGGHGGWNDCNSNSELQRQKAIKSNKKQKELHKNSEWLKRKSNKISKSLKEGYSSGRLKVREDFPMAFKGKTHSSDSKEKIGKANSKHQKGEGNSQFGTCWIFNLSLKENKKINKDELEIYLNLGWQKGRKMKF